MPRVEHPEFVPDHSLSREEMTALQRSIVQVAVYETASSVDPATLGQQIVVGVDQAFFEDYAISAIVAVRDGTVIEETYAVTPVSIEYIPGFLSFREGGPIIEAFDTLGVDPDLVVFDGNGQLHFEQVGLATHMGVVFDLPSIGVAKRLLCGSPDSDTAELSEGDRVAIRPDDTVAGPPADILGYAVQTRRYRSGTNTINPVYVSPGHRIGPETACDLVLELCDGYKLPEPIRLADRLAGEVKTDLGA